MTRDNVGDGAVHLGAVQASLGLFAEAIAGEPVIFESTEDRAGWPWVTPAPVNAPSPEPITVPSVLDLHDNHPANRRAGRAIVLHQLLARRARREATSAIDVAKELGRARSLEPILALVEDLRIDAETRRRYPGATTDLNALLQSARSQFLTDPEGLVALDALRLCSIGASSSDLGARLPMLADDVRDFIVSETAKVTTPSATFADSLTVARRLAPTIATGVLTLPEGDDEPDSEPSVDAPSDNAGGGVPSAGATPTEFEPAEGLSHGHAATDGAGALNDTPADDDVTTGLSIESTSTQADRAPRSFVYDEWDYLQQRHRAGWCRVLEETLQGTDHDFIGDVRSRYRELRHDIRRSFGRLRPTDLVRVYRCDDGDEVDLDAAIEARVDRRTGAPADDRLHIRRDRGARDVATAFLIDLSASTSSPAVSPEQAVYVPGPDDPYEDVLSYAPLWGSVPDAKPERRVIDVAVDAVALMSDALYELGDRHALYGFSGTGRHDVEFKVAKEFDDRVSPSTWAALAAMKPLRYTRMGPAIRHATVKLRAQTARTRLLIAISDGYPQDVDYGDDPRDRTYGVQDTARALADAARAGIDTFCVTIDPAGHDYLREMMPDDRYLVIDEVEALPTVLPQLYLTLAS